jgi:hypothetical protein
VKGDRHLTAILDASGELVSVGTATEVETSEAGPVIVFDDDTRLEPGQTICFTLPFALEPGGRLDPNEEL